MAEGSGSRVGAGPWGWVRWAKEKECVLSGEDGLGKETLRLEVGWQGAHV